MSFLKLENINKSFGSTKVLSDINLEIKKGELMVFVGPSGCGKSTLLRLIAGLESPTSGRIWLEGAEIQNREPQDRNLAMVFQSYALYPHLSVFENLAFGLRIQKIPQSQVQSRVDEMAEILKIGNYLQRKPKELSGGQRQRVAVGRALIRRSPVILLDEPLSNLDAHLRTDMRVELKKLHTILCNTMIYVTHDQVEATTLGDRMAVFQGGALVQLATPEKIYETPHNLFVAQFVGSPEINILPGENLGLPNCILGVRPEAIHLEPGQIASDSLRKISAKFEVQEYLGSQYLIHTTWLDRPLRVLHPKSVSVPNGEPVTLYLNMKKVLRFEKNSGLLQA